MKTVLFSQLRRAFALSQLASNEIDTVRERAATSGESRRQFLKTAGQAGLLLGIGGPAMAGELLLPGRRMEKIAIVGAGMSGLSAGYYLRRKGVKATLFEGDKRCGGRIKSAQVFAEGRLNTEIGAEFIDTNHSDMLWFSRMLGLEGKLMDVGHDQFGLRDAFFIEGRHYTLADVLEEFRAAYPRIEADQLALEGQGLAALDRLSMAEYISGLPVSDWVKKMIDAAFVGENGLETAEQSAANLLSIFAIKDDKFYPFGDSDERYKIIGGNDQIPKGLAAILEGQIRYEHRLQAIREKSNRTFELSFNQGGKTLTETFDAVIMTLPFTIVRDLDIQMELPPLKQQVIRELGYGTNSKFILETQNRPWREAGYRGFLFNEEVHNGWDSAQMQLDNQGAGSFTCYLGGKAGKNAAKGDEIRMREKYAPILEKAFPGTAASLTGGIELANWPSNPFIKASYSCFAPGQVSTFVGAAFEPVRNLYFAGEHCSTDFWGFMNGAAETGRKTAEAVLKKMRIR